MENYISIGEITRNKRERKKRRAKKRYTSTKLTTYGYGFKVKTTLTRLDTSSAPQSPPNSTPTLLQIPSLHSMASSTQSTPKAPTPLPAAKTSQPAANQNQERQTARNGNNEVESSRKIHNKSSVKKGSTNMKTRKKNQKKRLTSMVANQKAIERNRPCSRPKVQVNSETTSTYRDLPYDIETSERKTAHEEESTSIRNESATKKEKVKENDLNLTRDDAAKK